MDCFEDEMEADLGEAQFLAWEDIDRLWRLNRDWIRAIPDDISISYQDYLDAAPARARKRLTRFFDFFGFQIVSGEEFLREFDECAERAIRHMALASKGTRFVIVCGESLEKSNTWATLLFWHVYRTRFSSLNLDICFASNIQSLVTKDTVFVGIDDCMYSGQQMVGSLIRVRNAIIICPYASTPARMLVQRHLPCARLFFSVIPPIVTCVRDEDLADLFEVNGLIVTWIFSHKVADNRSIPAILLTCPPLFKNERPMQLEEHRKNLMYSGIEAHPCPLLKTSSLIPFYKRGKMRLDQDLLAKTRLVFKKQHRRAFLDSYCD